MTPKQKIKIYKIRLWISKNKFKAVSIIGTCAFLVFGIAVMGIGYALSGVDILKWFTSQWAYILYACFVVWVLVVALIMIYKKGTDGKY